MPSRLKPKSPRYLKGDHDVHSIPHTPDVSLPQVPRHADLRELWGQNSHCETRNSHCSAGWPSPHTPLPGHQENAPQHSHLLPLISWTALLPCRAVLACPTACPQSDRRPWDPRSPTQGQHSDGPFTPLHYFLAMETAWPQPEEPQHNLYCNKAGNSISQLGNISPPDFPEGYSPTFSKDKAQPPPSLCSTGLRNTKEVPGHTRDVKGKHLQGNTTKTSRMPTGECSWSMSPSQGRTGAEQLCWSVIARDPSGAPQKELGVSAQVKCARAAPWGGGPARINQA